jgi:hypothetical protein
VIPDFQRVRIPVAYEAIPADANADGGSADAMLVMSDLPYRHRGKSNANAAAFLSCSTSI